MLALGSSQATCWHFESVNFHTFGKLLRCSLSTSVNTLSKGENFFFFNNIKQTTQTQQSNIQSHLKTIYSFIGASQRMSVGIQFIVYHQTYNILLSCRFCCLSHIPWRWLKSLLFSSLQTPSKFFLSPSLSSSPHLPCCFFSSKIQPAGLSHSASYSSAMCIFYVDRYNRNNEMVGYKVVKCRIFLRKIRNKVLKILLHYKFLSQLNSFIGVTS